MKDREDYMDNFAVNVTARSLETFRNAFRLAFNPPGGKATHYRIVKLKQSNWMFHEDVDTFVFYWSNHDAKEAIELAYPMNVEAALSLAEHWLGNVEYPEQPDHDGSNEKGFIVSTGDFWGHIESHGAIVGVQPCWALLGK